MKTSARLEYWRRMLADYEQSGKTIREFCQKQGVSDYSFYAWRKRIGRETPVTFALVETNPPAAAIPITIEVALITGERLRIPCEAAALRLVLGVLREARV
jgi:transposase-like protein